MTFFCYSTCNTLCVQVENVPYGIRWMCKQLAVLGREAFPTAADEQIDSLVGGFINLRYINPAIVTPGEQTQKKRESQICSYKMSMS